MKFLVFSICFQIGFLKAQDLDKHADHGDFAMLGIAKKHAADGVYENAIKLYKRASRIIGRTEEIQFVAIYSHSEFDANWVVWMILKNGILKGVAFHPDETGGKQWKTLLSKSAIKIEKYKKLYKLIKKVKQEDVRVEKLVESVSTIDVFMSDKDLVFKKQLIKFENKHGNNLKKFEKTVNMLDELLDESRSSLKK